MNDLHQKADQTGSPLSGRGIIIVGPNKLQNSLMASYLSEATGASCRFVDRFNEIPKRANGREGPARLVLLDCRGKDLNGCLLDFKSLNRRIHARDLVAFFNTRVGRAIEENLAALGVHGFFYENTALEKLARGVTAIAHGALWIPREIMAEYFIRGKRAPYLNQNTNTFLTSREKEILIRISKGATNKEISDELVISNHTVKSHLYNIYKKIKVPNRLQASLWASKHL